MSSPAPTPRLYRQFLMPLVIGFGAGIVVIALGLAAWFFELKPKPPPSPPAPPISLPATVQAHIGRICTIEAATTGKSVRWKVLTGPDQPDLMQHDATAVHFVTPTPGDYRLQAITVVAGEVADAETHVLVDVGPSPPVPPKPPVPPEPPTPPAPIPASGLHVLMVYDEATLPKLSAAQLDVLNSEPLKTHLKDVGAKGPEGSWRCWGKETDATNESKVWQDAMKRPMKSLPWIIISNGKTGYEGPLPATVDEVTKLIAKYEGS